MRAAPSRRAASRPASTAALRPSPGSSTSTASAAARVRGHRLIRAHQQRRAGKRAGERQRVDQEFLVERGARGIVHRAGEAALAVGQRPDRDDGGDRHRPGASLAAKASVRSASARESASSRITVCATWTAMPSARMGGGEGRVQLVDHHAVDTRAVMPGDAQRAGLRAELRHHLRRRPLDRPPADDGRDRHRRDPARIEKRADFRHAEDRRDADIGVGGADDDRFERLVGEGGGRSRGREGPPRSRRSGSRRPGARIAGGRNSPGREGRPRRSRRWCGPAYRSSARCGGGCRAPPRAPPWLATGSCRLPACGAA